MSDGTGDRRRLAVLAVIVVAVFSQVIGFEFLIYDDDRYVSGNPMVRDGLSLEGLRWAFGSFHEGTWQPVTWLSHMLDASLWGEWAGGHHLTNLVLHLASALLLYLLLRRTTGRAGPSLLVALLWAVHPLQVQSVAWVAERKGLLATFFGLLVVERFGAWVRAGRARDLLAVHLFFAVSLASKPTWVVLPLLLLFWERWPLRRQAPWRTRLLEKSALLMMAALAALVAARAQAAAGALSSLDSVGVGVRMANAAVAFERTLRRMIAPVDLAAFYPFRFELPATEIALGAGLFVAGCALAWRQRRARPMLLTGWLWALLTFLPASQLMQFGGQATADRFAVMPLLGILIAVVYTLAPRSNGRWSPRLRATVAGVLVAAVAGGSLLLLPSWHDTVRLFERNLRVTGGSSLLHFNLGLAHENRGDARAAIAQYTRALEFAPESVRIRSHLADALRAAGNYAEAARRAREAVEGDPLRAEGHVRLGQLLYERGDYEEAGRSWFKATQLEPREPRWLVLLGQAMGALERPGDQLALYQRALALNPGLPELRGEMAWVLATTPDSTLRDAPEALRLANAEVTSSGGSSPRALEVRAAALAAAGRVEEAIRVSQEAEELARRLGVDTVARDIRTRRDLYLPGGESTTPR